ncbi:hypothetical protein [Streptomyces sp. NPDC059092]
MTDGSRFGDGWEDRFMVDTAPDRVKECSRAGAGPGERHFWPV